MHEKQSNRKVDFHLEPLIIETGIFSTVISLPISIYSLSTGMTFQQMTAIVTVILDRKCLRAMKVLCLLYVLICNESDRVLAMQGEFKIIHIIINLINQNKLAWYLPAWKFDWGTKMFPSCFTVLKRSYPYVQLIVNVLQLGTHQNEI